MKDESEVGTRLILPLFGKMPTEKEAFQEGVSRVTLCGERQRWVITGNSISADNAREILKAELVVPLNIVLCSLNNLRGDETSNATLSI